jgi:hypothetical protein
MGAFMAETYTARKVFQADSRLAAGVRGA